MFSGEYIFSQVMDHLPMHTFRKCVERYSGNRYVKSFNCFDQFLCMAFGQLTHRESLRDIEICLRAHNPKLYHIGIRGGISRNTFSNANKTRDWRIYADFALALKSTLRKHKPPEIFNIMRIVFHNNKIYQCNYLNISKNYLTT